MRGKCLIFSAPSGSGKSTIVNWLLTHPELKMVFSISATSRAPRGTEQNGVEYFFLTSDEFRTRIANGDFLEYEEVYPGCFYGTLKEQVEKRLDEGMNVVFDVDGRRLQHKGILRRSGFVHVHTTAIGRGVGTPPDIPRH